jgi:hypothetical protein
LMYIMNIGKKTIYWKKCSNYIMCLNLNFLSEFSHSSSCPYWRYFYSSVPLWKIVRNSLAARGLRTVRKSVESISLRKTLGLKE